MNYQDGKIYVVRNTVNKKLYYGSTCQPLHKRFHDHKNSTSGYKKDRNLYKAMNELGFENFYIELVENFPCNSKPELVAREGHYIRVYNTHKEGYNMLVAGRSVKEWIEDNKEHVLAKRKEYHEKNKDKLNAKSKAYFNEHKEELIPKNKEYYNKNKDKLNAKKKEYYETHKDEVLSKQKERYEDNKGEILQKQKEYYQKNKEVILSRNKEYIEKTNYNRSKADATYRDKNRYEIECECGAKVIKGNLPQHRKTLKHLNYINKK